MADVTLSSILISGFPYRKQVTFTSSQSWTLPATAMASVDYVVIGAGASGAAHTSDSVRTGGGGGQYVEGIANLVPGDTYSIVVGAGGTAVSGTTSGVDGGASEIVGIATAGGGKGDGRAGHGQPVTQDQDTINPNGGGAFLAQARAYTAAQSQTGPAGRCSGGATIHSNENNSARLAGIPGINGGACADNNSDTPLSAGSGSAPGCGGGARTYSSSASRKSGAGFRGEVVVTYWDSVP